jgi:hypothetical protein
VQWVPVFIKVKVDIWAKKNIAVQWVGARKRHHLSLRQCALKVKKTKEI